jgi:hypothetical protein
VGKNWKLELRYGRRTTPYEHYTGIAEGEVGELTDGFSCRRGPAFMDLHGNEDVGVLDGAQVGFTTTGNIRIYKTDPAEPPGENPRGYDTKLTPFEEGSD